MKKLIINADDFGLTEGVNRAVIACHEAGVVTSTTLMVTAAAAGGAARLARAHPGLGVGLHLNLTAGPPAAAAADIKSLTGPGGEFPGLRAMLWRLTAGRARRRELEREIGAQIALCRELGIEPTHVDSHHHLHAHPRLRRALALVCAREGIKKARGYRMAPRSAKAVAIRLAAAASGGGRLRTPERFAGIEAMGGRDMAQTLKNELAATPPGGAIEFMCHPGYADAELGRISSYSAPRQQELEALLSEAFQELVKSTRDARPVSFREL